MRRHTAPSDTLARVAATRAPAPRARAGGGREEGASSARAWAARHFAECRRHLTVVPGFRSFRGSAGARENAHARGAPRTDGGDGRDDLAELELVQDGGLARSVEAHHLRGGRGRGEREGEGAARRGAAPPGAGAGRVSRSIARAEQPRRGAHCTRRAPRAAARARTRMRISFLENRRAMSLVKVRPMATGGVWGGGRAQSAARGVAPRALPHLRSPPSTNTHTPKKKGHEKLHPNINPIPSIAHATSRRFRPRPGSFPGARAGARVRSRAFFFFFFPPFSGALPFLRARARASERAAVARPPGPHSF